MIYRIYRTALLLAVSSCGRVDVNKTPEQSTIDYATETGLTVTGAPECRAVEGGHSCCIDTDNRGEIWRLCLELRDLPQ